MCGICGFANYNGPADETLLRPMMDKLTHRGPDDAGSHRTGNVALGHRRLSIIDPAGGHQPIFNEDKTLAIVQNGEFYNFPQTRDELTRRGHRFTTSSDAEIFLHLYEEHGADAVSHVQGMFAVALYDEKNATLLLCRDRLGQKPLYYCLTPKGIVFASELKSLMAHPDVPSALNRTALNKYFFYDYIPGEETIYRGVHKLPAGHLLTLNLKSRELKKKCYWDIPLFNPEKAHSLQTVRQQLSLHLQKAVEKRLRADVPVGILLSGGLDSSIIACLAQKLRDDHTIETFSIGYQEKSYDESNYSALVARHLGAKHHHFELTAEGALDTLQKIRSFIDEPYADPSLVPTFYLAEHTRRHVKVALGGDGSDELFAGYQVFPLLKAYWPFRALRPALKPLASLVGLLTPGADSYASARYAVTRFRDSLDIPQALIQLASMFGSFSLREIRELTNDSSASFDDQLLEEIKGYLARRRSENAVSQMQYCLAKLYLGEGVLVKVDRASMANSLEVRSPFLDHYLFHDVFESVPPALRMKGFRTKHILKETFKDALPPEIIRRPKKGFAMPLSAWIREGFRGEIDTMLSPKRISAQGLLNEKYVTRIVNEHYSGKADHRKKIWSLLMMQYWVGGE